MAPRSVLLALSLLVTAAPPTHARPRSEAAARRLHLRTVRKVAKLVRLPEPGSRADRQRAAVVEAWEARRQAALAVIFDATIYPDADHGRVGQPKVDAAVDEVRAVWPVLDGLARRDLRKLMALEPEDAQALLATLAEGGDGSEALTSETRILLARRAGEPPAPEAFAAATPWVRALLLWIDHAAVQARNAALAARPPADAVRPTALELEQVRLTNAYRHLLGRAPLALDLRLVASARGHANDMVRLGFFDHTSPVTGKETATDRMSAAGYPSPGGENIAMGQATPQAAHDGWYRSSGHHRNMLQEDYRAMGTGNDGRHWVQNFGR